VHVLGVIALLLTPLAPDNYDGDLFNTPNHFVATVLERIEQQPKPNVRLEPSGSKAGGRHHGPEGPRGTETAKLKTARPSAKGAPIVDPKTREDNRRTVMNSAIFRVLAGAQGSAASRVLGSGGFGEELNTATAGLNGRVAGHVSGLGGMGTRGHGDGGGGQSMGIGGIGKGPGTGLGGLGDADLGGRGRGAVDVPVTRKITKGCLSQATVVQVIDRRRAQAKYCYDSELTRNPNLGGKITVKFEIGASGAVTRARVLDSTMGDSKVEQCLLRVVHRMRFPPCKGGGTASVTYPWLFKSGIFKSGISKSGTSK